VAKKKTKAAGSTGISKLNQIDAYTYPEYTPHLYSFLRLSNTIHNAEIGSTGAFYVFT
jgi:hypothetical protein